MEQRLIKWLFQQEKINFIIMLKEHLKPSIIKQITLIANALAIQTKASTPKICLCQSIQPNNKINNRLRWLFRFKNRNFFITFGMYYFE